MTKKDNKGCVGNFVDSILSDPIKKKKHTEELQLPSGVDSLTRNFEQQPAKKIRASKKKIKK